MTSANSASNAGLLMKISVPSRTRLMSACGVPCHSRPDLHSAHRLTHYRVITAGDGGV